MTRRSGFAIAPSDGTPLYYALTGADDAAGAVVLCDGIGCDGYVWKYLERSLGERYRVVRWHYRGHGRTPMPRDPARLAIADLADDLAAVLDECELSRAAVFGHSMGVQVALESYRRHADRVSALGLLCGAPGRPLDTFRGSSLGDRILPLLRGVVGAAPRFTNAVWRIVMPTSMSYWISARVEVNGVLIERDDFTPYLEGLARVDVPMFFAMLAEAQRHSALELLPSIAVPTLIIAGDRDGFTPARLSERMRDEIPGAELLMIEGGSHTAPLERPHLVGDTVLAFLARALG